MPDKKKLKIKIFDKEYSLLVENEEIAKELAIYVNKVMEETKEELPDQAAQTIAHQTEEDRLERHQEYYCMFKHCL